MVVLKDEVCLIRELGLAKITWEGDWQSRGPILYIGGEAAIGTVRRLEKNGDASQNISQHPLGWLILLLVPHQFVSQILDDVLIVIFLALVPEKI